MKDNKKKFIPVLVLYIIINTAVFVCKSFLLVHGFDTDFLLIANLILCVLCLLGFIIQMKGLKSTNMNAFIRSLYSSLLFKMVVVMIAVIIYIFISGGKVNQPSLFTSMGLYFVYTGIEVTQLMKIARRKPNV